MNEDLPQITDDTIEVGEATLANIGFTTIVKGDMPRIGIGKQKEIIATNKKIDGLAKEFVYDELITKMRVPRPYTYPKLLARFTKPLSEAEIANINSKFPPDANDTTLSFISTLQGAYTKVADEVPVSTIDTYLGPTNLKPTSDKDLDFWLQYWIIDDPFVVFRLMQCGALQPAQVDTLKVFYPSIYNYMIAAILNALVDRNLKEPKFINLPPRADRGLATLKQQRVVDYGPNIHVAQPTEPTPQSPKPMRIDKGLQTQGQRADAV